MLKSVIENLMYYPWNEVPTPDVELFPFGNNDEQSCIVKLNDDFLRQFITYDYFIKFLFDYTQLCFRYRKIKELDRIYYLNSITFNKLTRRIFLIKKLSPKQQ